MNDILTPIRYSLNMEHLPPVPVSRPKTIRGMNKFIPRMVYTGIEYPGDKPFLSPSCEIIPRGIKIHRYKVLFLKMRIIYKSML